MSAGKIYFNDKFVPVKELGGAMQLLHADYLYQTVNTYDHRTLYLKEHLDCLNASHQALYGKPLELSPQKIERQTANLLHENRMPFGGNTVNIIVMPDSDGPDIVIEHNRTTIYKGFSIQSLRPRAIITNYEIPFEQHMTSVSEQTAAFMNSVAQRSSMNIAIRANRRGLLISAGDYPLFAVRNGQIFTVPVSEGARVCAERDLMFRLCRQAGVVLNEQDVRVSDLKSFDELMIFTPMGLQSVLCCNSIYFHSGMASRLDKMFPAFTKSGFLKR